MLFKVIVLTTCALVCEPTLNAGVLETKKHPITKETWDPMEQKGNQFEIQSKSDAIILLHTLFPTKEGAEKTGEGKRFAEAKKKAEVLTRLFILLQEAPLNLKSRIFSNEV